MKTALSLVFIIITNLGICQEKKTNYSLYLGGGAPSHQYLRKIFFSGRENPEGKGHLCPVLNAGIQVTRGKWRIGPAFSYDHFGPRDRSIEFSTLSYYVRGDRLWKNNQRNTIYSGFYPGLSVFKKLQEHKVIEKKINPCFQVVVIGTEFRINEFSIDLSFGYGMAGAVCGSLRYRFH